MSLKRGLASGLLFASALLAAPGLSQSAWAARATLVLNDGRTFEGDLVEETPDRVVLAIAGIKTPFERDQVKELKVVPGIREQYEERRKALRDDDVQGRLDLGYWLFNEGEYDLAQTEVADLRTRFPDDERVGTLLTAIVTRREAATDAAGPARPAGNASRPAQPRPQPAEAADGLPLLTDAQINLVKVWELPEDLSQTQVRIRVGRETLQKAFDRFADSPAVPGNEEGRRRLVRAPVPDQVAFLFDLGHAVPEARELYSEIEVAGDPESILGFRRTVYPTYFQRYFRPAFGGGQVPGFRLVPTNANTNAEVYSNFAILSTTDIDGQPMIDRQSPEDSLLLQWGLPRELARRPAPQVPGWRPFFSGPEDRNFREIADWIRSLYDTAQVDYGFVYPPEDATPEEGGEPDGSAPRQPPPPQQLPPKAPPRAPDPSK